LALLGQEKKAETEAASARAEGGGDLVTEGKKKFNEKVQVVGGEGQASWMTRWHFLQTGRRR